MPSAPGSAASAVVPAAVADRAFQRSGAARWGVRPEDFTAALGRSVAGRFHDQAVAPGEIAAFVEGLHVADLALAAGCASGSDPAWDHFIREFRPVLVRVAGRNAPPDAARDVADTLYADLYGMELRDGRRRSLFDYYHGRSALASWLRAVVAQRLIDRARSGRRTEALPEAGGPGEPPSHDGPPDVDRLRLLPAVRAALTRSIADLEPRDRLRLSLYYTQDLTLAAIGRALGESEATASRKLERTRRAVRATVERRLRDDSGMSATEIRQSFDYARTDPAFDLARDLPPN